MTASKVVGNNEEKKHRVGGCYLMLISSVCVYWAREDDVTK